MPEPVVTSQQTQALNQFFKETRDTFRQAVPEVDRWSNETLFDTLYHNYPEYLKHQGFEIDDYRPEIRSGAGLVERIRKDSGLENMHPNEVAGLIRKQLPSLADAWGLNDPDFDAEKSRTLEDRILMAFPYWIGRLPEDDSQISPELQKALKEYEESEDKGQEGFWHALATGGGAAGWIPYVGDIKGAVDAVSLLRLASKAEDDPDSLTDEETIGLNLMLAAALEDENKGWRARAGDITRDSVVFGLEWLLFIALAGGAVTTGASGVGAPAAAGLGTAATATGAAAAGTAARKTAAAGLRKALVGLAEKVGLRASRKAAVRAGNVGFRKWAARLAPKTAEKFAARAATITAGHPARAGRALLSSFRDSWLDTGMKLAYRSNFNPVTGALKEGAKKTFWRQSLARGTQIAMADLPIALGMTTITSGIKMAGSAALGGEGKSRTEAQREVGEYLSGRPASEILADQRMFRDLGSAFIENFSETLGEDMFGPALGAFSHWIGGLHLGKGGPTVAKLAGSTARKYFDDAARALERGGADAARLNRLRRITGKMALFNEMHPVWAQTQGDLLRAMHYDGLINEWAEERAGDFMYGLAGWEGDGSRGDPVAAAKHAVEILGNWDDFRTEAVSLAFPSAVSFVRSVVARNIASSFDSDGLRLLELLYRGKDRRTSPSADPRYSGISSEFGEAPAKPGDAAQGATGMASAAGFTYLGKDDKQARAEKVGQAEEAARAQALADLEEEASRNGGRIVSTDNKREVPLMVNGELSEEARRRINKAIVEAGDKARQEHDQAWKEKVEAANAANETRRAELEKDRDGRDAQEEDKGAHIQMLRQLAADELRQKQAESTSEGAFSWYGAQIERIELGLEDTKLRETAEQLSNTWDSLPEDRRRALAAKRKGVLSKEDADAIKGTLTRYIMQMERQSRSQGRLLDLVNLGLQWATGLVWVNGANATDRTDGRGGFEAAADMALRRYGVARFLTQAHAYSRALWDSEIDPAARPVSEYEFSEVAEQAHAAVSDNRAIYVNNNDKASALKLLKEFIEGDAAAEKAARDVGVGLKPVDEYKDAAEILADIGKVDDALRADPAKFGITSTGKTHVIPAEDYKTADGKEARYTGKLGNMTNADAERYPKAAALARSMEEYVARRAAEHTYQNVVLPFMHVLSVIENLTTDEISRLRATGMDEEEFAKKANIEVAKLNGLLAEGKLDKFLHKDPKTKAITLKDIELATGELVDESDALLRREILGRMGIHTAYRDVDREKEAKETLYRKPFNVTYKVNGETDRVEEKPRLVTDTSTDPTEQLNASRAPFAIDENEDLGTVAQRIDDTIRAIERAKLNAESEDEAGLWDEALKEAKERMDAAMYLLATSDFIGSGEWITADTVRNILSKGPKGLKISRGDTAQVRLLKVMLGAARDNIDIGDPDVLTIARTLGLDITTEVGRSMFAEQAKFFANKIAQAMQEQPLSVGMVLHTEDNDQNVTGRYVVDEVITENETRENKEGDKKQGVVHSEVVGLYVVPLTDSGLRYPENHPKYERRHVEKHELGNYRQTPLQKIRFTRRALTVEGTRNDFLSAGYADLSTGILENPTVRVNDSAGNIDTKRSRYRLRVNAMNSANGDSITFGLLYDQGVDEDLLESMMKRTKAFKKIGAASEVKGVHLHANQAYALPAIVKDALDEALDLISSIPSQERTKDQQAALDLLDVHNEEGKEVTPEEYARVERARFEIVGKVWMQSFGGYQAMPTAMSAEYMREARALALAVKDQTNPNGGIKPLTGAPTEYSHLANVMDFVYHSIVGEEYMGKLQYHAFGNPVPSALEAEKGRRETAKAGSDEWVKRGFVTRRDALDRDLTRMQELYTQLTSDKGDLEKADQELSDRKTDLEKTRARVVAVAADHLLSGIEAGRVDVGKVIVDPGKRAEFAATRHAWRRAVDEYGKKKAEIYGEDGTREPTGDERKELEDIENRVGDARAKLSAMLRELVDPIQQAAGEVLANDPELNRQLAEDEHKVLVAENQVVVAHSEIVAVEGQIERIRKSVRDYTDLINKMQELTNPTPPSDLTNGLEPGEDAEQVEGGTPESPNKDVQPRTPQEEGGKEEAGQRKPEDQRAENNTGEEEELTAPSPAAVAEGLENIAASLEAVSDNNARAREALGEANGDFPADDIVGDGEGTSVESAATAPQDSQESRKEDARIWFGVDIRQPADPESYRIPESLQGRPVSLLSIVAATSTDEKFVRARSELAKLLRGGLSDAQALVGAVELLAEEMARFSGQINDANGCLLTRKQLDALRKLGSNPELIEKRPDRLGYRTFYVRKIAQALMDPQHMANLRVSGRLTANEHLAAMVALYTFDRDFRTAYEATRTNDDWGDDTSDEETPNNAPDDGDFDNEKRFDKLNNGSGDLVDNLMGSLLEKNGGSAYRNALGQMALDIPKDQDGPGRYLGRFHIGALQPSNRFANPQAVAEQVRSDMEDAAKKAGRPAPTLKEITAETDLRITKYLEKHSPLYSEENWNEAVEAMRAALDKGIQKDGNRPSIGEGELGILRLMSSMSYASARTLLPSWFSKEYTPVNSMVIRLTGEGLGYELVPNSDGTVEVSVDGVSHRSGSAAGGEGGGVGGVVLRLLSGIVREIRDAGSGASETIVPKTLGQLDPELEGKSATERDEAIRARIDEISEAVAHGRPVYYHVPGAPVLYYLNNGNKNGEGGWGVPSSWKKSGRRESRYGSRNIMIGGSEAYDHVIGQLREKLRSLLVNQWGLFTRATGGGATLVPVYAGLGNLSHKEFVGFVRNRLTPLSQELARQVSALGLDENGLIGALANERVFPNVTARSAFEQAARGVFRSGIGGANKSRVTQDALNSIMFMVFLRGGKSALIKAFEALEDPGRDATDSPEGMADRYVSGIQYGLQTRLIPSNENSATLSDCLRAYADLVTRSYCTFVPGKDGAPGHWVPGDTLSPLASLTEEQVTAACTESDALKEAREAAASGNPLRLTAAQLSALVWEHDLKYMSGGNAAITGVNSLVHAIRAILGDIESGDKSIHNLEMLSNQAQADIPVPAAPAENTESAEREHDAAVKARSVRVADRLLNDAENALHDAVDLHTRMYDPVIKELVGKNLLVRGHVLFRNYLTPTQVRQPGSSAISTLVYPSPFQTWLKHRLVKAGVIDEDTPFSVWQVTGDMYGAAANPDASPQDMIQHLVVTAQIRNGGPVLSIMLPMNDKDKQPPSANLKREAVVEELRRGGSVGSAFSSFLASLEDIRSDNQSPQSFLDAADAWDRAFPEKDRPAGAARMSILLRTSAAKARAKGVSAREGVDSALELCAGLLQKAVHADADVGAASDAMAFAAAAVADAIGGSEAVRARNAVKLIRLVNDTLQEKNMAARFPEVVIDATDKYNKFERARATAVRRIVSGNYAGLVRDALMEDAKAAGTVYLAPSASTVPGTSEGVLPRIGYREAVSVRRVSVESREADGTVSRKLQDVLEIRQVSDNGKDSRAMPVNTYVTACFLAAGNAVLERNMFGPGSMFGQNVWNRVAPNEVEMYKRARLLTTSFIPMAVTDRTGVSTHVLVLDKPKNGGLVLEVEGADGKVEEHKLILSSDGSQLAGSAWSKIMRDSMGGTYDGAKSITMSGYLVLKGNTVSVDGMDRIQGNNVVIPALDDIMNELSRSSGVIVSEVVDDGAAKVVNLDEGQWDRVDQVSAPFVLPDGRTARVRARGLLVRRFNADTGRVANLQHDAREIDKKLFANYNESWGHTSEAQRAMVRSAYAILGYDTDAIRGSYDKILQTVVARVVEEVEGELGAVGPLLQQGASPDLPIIRTYMWTRIRSALAKALAPQMKVVPLQLVGARMADTDHGAPSTHLLVRDGTALPTGINASGFRYTPAVIDANIAGARYAWRLNDSVDEAEAMEAVRAAAEAQYELIRLENKARLDGIKVPGASAEASEQVPADIRSARDNLAAKMQALDGYYTDFHGQKPSDLCSMFGHLGVPLQDLLVERKTEDGAALSLDNTAFGLTNDGKQKVMFGSLGIDHRMPTGYAGTATVVVRVGLPVTTKIRTVRTTDANGRKTTKKLTVPGNQNLAILPNKLERAQGKDNDGDTDYVQLLTDMAQLSADAGTAEMARDGVEAGLGSLAGEEGGENFDRRLREARRRARDTIVRMKISSYRNLTPQEATLEIDKETWLKVAPEIVDDKGEHHPVIGAAPLGTQVDERKTSRTALGYMTPASYMQDRRFAAEAKSSGGARAAAVTALDGISALALDANENTFGQEIGSDGAAVFYSDMATLRVIFTTLANLAFDAVGDPILQTLNVPREAVGLFQRFFTAPGRLAKARRLITEGDPRGMEKAMVAEWMAFVRRPEVRAYISMLVNGRNGRQLTAERIDPDSRDSWNGTLTRVENLRAAPDSEFVPTREDPTRNLGSVLGVAATRKISYSAFARQLARWLSSSMGEGDIFKAPVERDRDARGREPSEGAMDGMDVAVAVARSVLDGSYYDVRGVDAALASVKKFLGDEFDLSTLDSADGIERAMEKIKEEHDRKKQTEEYKALSAALNEFFRSEAVPALARVMSGGVDLSQLTRFIKIVEKATYDPERIGGLINSWAAMREQDLRPWLESSLGRRALKSLQQVVTSMAKFVPAMTSLMLSSIFTGEMEPATPVNTGLAETQEEEEARRNAKDREQLLKMANSNAYAAVPQARVGSESGIEGMMANRDALDYLYLVRTMAQEARGLRAGDDTWYNLYAPLADESKTAASRLEKFAKYLGALTSSSLWSSLSQETRDAMNTLLAGRDIRLAIGAPSIRNSLLSATAGLRNEGVATVKGNQNNWAKFPAWVRQFVPGAGIQDSLFGIAKKVADEWRFAAGSGEVFGQAQEEGDAGGEYTFVGVTVGAVGNPTGTQQQLISCLRTHEDRCLVVMALNRASKLLESKDADPASVRDAVSGLLAAIPGATDQMIDEFVENAVNVFRGKNASARDNLEAALTAIQANANYMSNVLGEDVASGKMSIAGFRRYVECAMATIMLRSASTETSASGHNYIQLFPASFIAASQEVYDRITGDSAEDRLGILPTAEEGYLQRAVYEQAVGDLLNRFGVSRVDQAQQEATGLESVPEVQWGRNAVPVSEEDIAFFETGTATPEKQALVYALRNGTSGAHTLPASGLPVVTVEHLAKAAAASESARTGYGNYSEALRDVENNFAAVLTDDSQEPAAVLVWPGVAKEKYIRSPGFPQFHGIDGYQNALLAAVTGADKAAKTLQDRRMAPDDQEILQRALLKQEAGRALDSLEREVLDNLNSGRNDAAAAFEQGVEAVKTRLSGGTSTSVETASTPTEPDESVTGSPRLTPKYVRVMAKRLTPELERSSTTSDAVIPGASLMPVTTASDDYVRRSVFNTLGVPESTQTSKLGSAGLEVVAPFLTQGRSAEDLVRFGVIGARVATALESGSFGALEALDNPGMVTELVREFGETDGKELARRIGQAVMFAREAGINAEHQAADPFVGYPAELEVVVPEGGVVRKAPGSGLDLERDDSTSTSVSSMASVVAERIAWELSVGGPSLVHKYLRDASYFEVANSNLTNSTMDSLMHIFGSDRSLTGLDLRDKEGNLKRNGFFGRWGALTTEGDRTIVRYTESERNLLTLVLMAIQAAATGQDYVFVQGAGSPIRVPEGQSYKQRVEEHLASSIGEDGMPDDRAVPVKLIVDTFKNSELRKKLVDAGRSEDELDIYKLANRLTDFVAAFRRRTEQFAGKFLAPEQLLGAVRADLPVAVSADGFRGMAWVDAARKVSTMARRVGSIGVGEVKNFDLAVELNPATATYRDVVTQKQLDLLQELKSELLRLYANGNNVDAGVAAYVSNLMEPFLAVSRNKEGGDRLKSPRSSIRDANLAILRLAKFIETTKAVRDGDSYSIPKDRADLIRTMMLLMREYDIDEVPAENLQMERFKDYREAFEYGRYASTTNPFLDVSRYVKSVLDVVSRRLVLEIMMRTPDARGNLLLLAVPENGIESEDISAETFKFQLDYMTKRMGHPADISKGKPGVRFDPEADPRELMLKVLNGDYNTFVPQIKQTSGIKYYERVPSPYRSEMFFYASAYGKPFSGRSRGEYGETTNAVNLLKHVIGRGPTLYVNIGRRRFDVAKAALDLVRWTKHVAVSNSMFFMFAGLESVIAGSGFKRGGFLFRLVNPFEKHNPLKQMRELSRAMKRGDPMYDQIMYDLHRAGLCLSDSVVTDLTSRDNSRWVQHAKELGESLGGKNGKKWGRRFELGATLLSGRIQSDWMMKDFFPALKTWGAIDLANEMSAKMPGVPRSEVYRVVAPIINAAYGGRNWHDLGWATPKAVYWMNLLLFAPQWTLAAWETAGGGLLTGHALGDYITPEQAKFVVRNWAAMYLFCLQLVPNLIQAAIYLAAGRKPPDDDDDPAKKDHWLAVMNERERGGWFPSIDITPLMRSKFGKILRLGREFDGGETGNRRVYVQFGKQSYEVLNGWFDNPKDQLLRKTSQPVKLVWEQLFGYSPGSSDFALPFAKSQSGFLGSILSSSKGFRGSRVSYIAQKFMPLTASQILNGQWDSAGLLIGVAPIKRGMSRRKATDAIKPLLESYADPVTYRTFGGVAPVKYRANRMFGDYVRALEENGYDAKSIIDQAQREVSAKYYQRFFEALEANDNAALEEAARSLIRLGITANRAVSSYASKYKSAHGTAMTKEQREAVRAAFDTATPWYIKNAKGKTTGGKHQYPRIKK